MNLATEAPKWQTPPPNRWMLHVDLDLRLAAAALLVAWVTNFSSGLAALKGNHPTVQTVQPPKNLLAATEKQIILDS